MDLGQLVHGVQKLTQEAGLAYNTVKPEVAKERLRDLFDLIEVHKEVYEVEETPEPAQTPSAEEAAAEVNKPVETEPPRPEAEPSEQ